MSSSNIANSTLITTDLNVDPYYDDFDKNKNYMKMLFRPGYAVQGRELTQLQTILQNQISSFGQHVFVDGSVVIPGRFSIDTSNIFYVKVNDRDINGNGIDIQDYKNKTVIGQTNGLRAIIHNVEDGVQTDTDTKTIFVNYLNSAGDGTIQVFEDGEILLTTDDTPISLVALSSSATGKGSMFSISEGIFFAKNHFISFPTQSVILDRYSTSPTCQVGFYINEDIIRYTDDQSLLDPALGSSNYSAPGADRFKLDPVLTRLEFDLTVGPPDYVALFSIKNGVVQTLYDRSQYSVLLDTLAKRTYDESGDYYVKGMEVQIRENLDTGTNYGFDANGSSALLSVCVQPGTGYVKGYPVGKLIPTCMTINKANTYQNINSQIISSSQGTYILVTEVVGNLIHDLGSTIISLYDTAMTRITSRVFSGAQTGNLIGTAHPKSLVYESGTPGTSSAVYKLYLYDIQMVSGNAFTSVKSVYCNNTASADFGADVVLDINNQAQLSDITNTLLYYVGSHSTRKIRSADDSIDTSFSFRTGGDYTASSGGAITIPVTSGTGEIFPYGTTTLNSAEKLDIQIVMNDTFNIALTGTTSGTVSTTSLVGSGTAFTRLNVGDKLEFSSNSLTYIITSIADNTNLVVDKVLPSNLTGNSIFKAYKTGDILNMNGVGSDAGTTRSVSATPSYLTVNLNETFPSTKSVSAVFNVTRTTAKEYTKVLRPNRIVIISCASAGTTGPFTLGFPDVYQIRQVRKNSGAFTLTTDGTDVTSNFTFDNGQTNDYYDHASITPNGITLTSTDYLLVELDYFYQDLSSGLGYASVDSYPVDDVTLSSTTIMTQNIPVFKSPISGASYDLRNFLDFRPQKTITAADSTTIAGATTNPSTTSSYNNISTGMRLVAPFESVTFDYSYYLARRSLVVVDKGNNFYVIDGQPAVGPLTPIAPDTTMALAAIYVAPYPSLAPIYAKSIYRQDLSCVPTKVATVRQTMRDIGVIKNRVDNLEYYASLSILEKSAADMKILGSDGLDRFKNGIFTDTFNDHSLGATYNSDYAIVVDTTEKSIRPIYTMDSVPYVLLANTNTVSSKAGDLVTLKYTETPVITQNKATTYRNMDSSIYKYTGLLQMSPSQDMWVDTDFVPEGPTDGNLTRANTYDGGPISTTWNAWQENITGLTVLYNQNGTEIFRDNGDGTATQNGFIVPWSGGLAAAESFAQEYANQTHMSVRLESQRSRSRTGTQSFLQTISDTVEGDGRILDVSLIPYIRPQMITITATGVKPNTKMYTFFDGTNMSNYVIPLSSTANTIRDWANTEATMYNHDGSLLLYGMGDGQSIQAANAGDPVVSTSEGIVNLILPIPKNSPKFTVGTKEVKLTDSPTNEDDATSSAKSYFVAQGLLEHKQGDTTSTRTKITTKTVTQTELGEKFTEYFDWDPASEAPRNEQGCCSAYTFFVSAPKGEAGLFLTSVDLYIAQKSATNGFWVEIREMNTAGNITNITVPFSQVDFLPDEITISDDGTEPHRVTFPAPIFLTNNTEYALILHAIGSNPDMYFWVSVLGETDITSGAKVNSRPYTGNYMETNNNRDWSIIKNVDLKVTFNRAVFDTSGGTVVVRNYPMEIFDLTSVSGDFNNYGEVIVTGDKLTLSGIYGGSGSIDATDLVIGVNTGRSGAVVSNVSTTYHVKNSGYIVGENVEVQYANSTSKGITATISSIATRGSGSLRKYSSNASVTSMIVYGSNGNFSAGNTIVGLSSGETANVNAISEIKYSVVDFEPGFLSFNKTTCLFEMQANSGSYFPLGHNQNYTFSTEKSLFSRSTEISQYSGIPSNNVRVTMSTTSDYMSPVLDMGRTHGVFVRNIINSNNMNEINSSGGSLKNKYISQTVTLADGQDAEDIRVILTAYRPPDTEIYVYAKIEQGEDVEVFSRKPYVQLVATDDTQRSAIGNPANFLEYTYGFPTSPYDRITLSNYGANTINIGDIISSNGVNGTIIAAENGVYTVNAHGFSANTMGGGWANVKYANSYWKGFTSNISAVGVTPFSNTETGVVEYTTDSGTRFTSYKQFAIKIGLAANNAAIVPKVADLRCIALQV